MLLENESIKFIDKIKLAIANGEQHFRFEFITVGFEEESKRQFLLGLSGFEKTNITYTGNKSIFEGNLKLFEVSEFEKLATNLKLKNRNYYADVDITKKPTPKRRKRTGKDIEVAKRIYKKFKSMGIHCNVAEEKDKFYMIRILESNFDLIKIRGYLNTFDYISILTDYEEDENTAKGNIIALTYYL